MLRYTRAFAVRRATAFEPKTKNRPVMSEAQKYDAGDCKCEHIGEIVLADGRRFMGAIVTFPVEPPKLPFSAVLNGTPLRLDLKP